ncbi:uncharacterized protein RHIMIDRAFT_257656 [Rhizopus microsporus ATCC 52813]|uniref:Uncharacterized protein n=1 Tax=Rhizopus microsporus ATCC 52813 TaxID=1340429 RepID=A0A2G4SSS7_RHIZD|nr:uncharacterized protein RHIMIDRAFT_257656 [Rhizopus microsporus ATCC 52813]PHZ11446.1 hypothetical protein RHIMIDRAFT_257656 [Rhizopus microsporus ATCC 52813]
MDATILPLEFQLLFNYKLEEEEEGEILKSRNRMLPVFKVELNQVSIYRLIHHEYDKHYISAGQLFQACGLTITEGLFLFELKLSDFEVDFLNSQFPFCDIWVSVEMAKSMASALGVDYELSLLLDNALDDCYSSDNVNRNEMMHNWIVPSIPHLQYSTRALLETRFEQVEMLSSNRKIRTQISRMRQRGIVMKDKTQNGLVRWQVTAYEHHLTKQDVWVDYGSIWDSMQGLLFDLQTLSREGRLVKNERVLPNNIMVGNMPLKRDHLNHQHGLQQVYIGYMIEKMMNELNRISLKDHNTQPIENSTSHHIVFHDRLDMIEQELYKMKKKGNKRIEEIEVLQQRCIQQLNEINNWKIKFEKTRQSERIWIFLFILSALFIVYYLYKINITVK